MTVQVTPEIYDHFQAKARNRVIADRPVRFA